MSLKKDISGLLHIKTRFKSRTAMEQQTKSSCIETFMGLATVSDAVITTKAASATPNLNSETTESPDYNSFMLFNIIFCMLKTQSCPITDLLSSLN